MKKIDLIYVGFIIVFTLVFIQLVN